MSLINCKIDLILTWLSNKSKKYKISIRSKTYAQNQYLNHLVNLSFAGVNTLFVSLYENEIGRISH